MAVQHFFAMVAGKLTRVFGIQSSAGASDGGKIPALDDTGRLSTTMMPVGVGPATQNVVTSEAIGAGKYVNLYSNAGVITARLADNSNAREAHGFVVTAFSSGATALVYPMDSPNTALSTLTPGAEYWLGTAGGVLSTPLDATDAGNAGKVSQQLGVAKSATEMITTDYSPFFL